MEKSEINIDVNNLPKEIRAIAGVLDAAQKKAYLVGGCLRDLLLDRVPKDWDIATDAKPEEIQELLPDSVYENVFGTVGVKTRSEEPSLAVVEVTTFRKDSEYSDARHPDEVTFAKTIEEDLARRDFTINALALQLETKNSKLKPVLVDPFNGLEDLKNKLIRAVGDPEHRFEEDALRLMRAVRFETQLGISEGWKIEDETKKALIKMSSRLELIASERIRDELVKMIMARDAAEGIRFLEEVQLLQYVIPELREGIDMGQNKHHIYTVFEHNVRALEYAASKDYSFHVRLSSLLHDVGKPRTKRGEGPNSTFYGHQVVGERMAREILKRLKFSKETINRVSLLVREHMFMYDPDVVTMAGVRRLLSRVGGENIDDLLKLREGDRIGSGVPKARTYRMRHLEAMIEKAKTEPIGPKMLKIDGSDLMNELGIKPGPKLGNIIFILLEMALEKTDINKKNILLEKAKELNELDEAKLEKMAHDARESAAQAQERIDKSIKDKFFVE